MILDTGKSPSPGALKSHIWLFSPLPVLETPSSYHYKADLFSELCREERVELLYAVAVMYVLGTGLNSLLCHQGPNYYSDVR